MGKNNSTKVATTKDVEKQPVRVFTVRRMAAQRENVGAAIKKNNATFKPL